MEENNEKHFARKQKHRNEGIQKMKKKKSEKNVFQMNSKTKN